VVGRAGAGTPRAGPPQRTAAALIRRLRGAQGGVGRARGRDRTRWFTAVERCGVCAVEKVGLPAVPGGSSVSHMKRLPSRRSHSSARAPRTA